MSRYPCRKLHLIDVENLAGAARPTPAEVARCRGLYENLVPVHQHDHVVIACNHGAAPTVGWGWPGRLILRSGQDGADLALLSVVTDEAISERFTEVVLGSGDGIFADAIASLQSAGVTVTVVSRHESLSNRSRIAASTVVLFVDELRSSESAGVEGAA